MATNHLQIIVDIPTGTDLQVEGNYAVDNNLQNKYLLVPVCSNCLQPIFPMVYVGYDKQPSMYYESRGTDEPAECSLCIAAYENTVCGKCGDKAPCDGCDILSEAAYMARYVPTLPKKEEGGN